MSLTNAQYNSIMKDYEQTRDRNRHLAEQRRLEVYTKLPEYGRLDESVGELSVAQTFSSQSYSTGKDAQLDSTL